MEMRLRVSDLVEAAATEAELIRKVVADLHIALKEDGSREVRSDSLVNLATLARHVHYTGLSIAEQRKSSKPTAHLKPAWKELLSHYSDMWKLAGEALDLPPVLEINDDHLSTLCYFNTRKTGTGKDNLYSGLALLLLYMKEKNLLESAFLSYSLPASERDFVGEIGKHIARKIEEARSGAPSISYPDISITFAYDPTKLAEFQRFHTRFKNLKDKCSHFVCYRPRKSDPTELMKTFLAVKPPEASRSDSTSFNFVHVYQPPEADDHNKRVALGKIIPLHEGLYFVGGQKEHRSEEKVEKTPFKTLKVIAVGWRTIEVDDPVLSGLVMSANSQGQHILSRILLRATPLNHSDNISLGSIKLRDLKESVRADTTKELAYLAEIGATSTEFGKFGLNKDFGSQLDSFAAKRAETILARCNNDVAWGVPDGFRAVTGRAVPLTKATIEADLEETFGSGGAPKFKDGSGNTFEFQKSIRFGVLAKK